MVVNSRKKEEEEWKRNASAECYEPGLLMAGCYFLPAGGTKVVVFLQGRSAEYAQC